jgi:hypothetical protein
MGVNEYVKISEDKLYGRIIRLALEGFFDEWGGGYLWNRKRLAN